MFCCCCCHSVQSWVCFGPPHQNWFVDTLGRIRSLAFPSSAITAVWNPSTRVYEAKLRPLNNANQTFHLGESRPQNCVGLCHRSVLACVEHGVSLRLEYVGQGGQW
jgi:hypothetical protein